MTMIEEATMKSIQGIFQKLPKLTLRDLFAMSALQTITNDNLSFEQCADIAYQQADAMLAVRSKKSEEMTGEIMCNCYREAVEKYRKETGDPWASLYACYSAKFGVVPVMRAYHKFKKKDGSLSRKNVIDTILPSFCPFCGKKYEE